MRYVVVGIGINVNQATFPPELQPIATSLRLVGGTEWSRVELCAALLKSLDREYRDLLEKRGSARIDFAAFSGTVVFGARATCVVEENGEFEGVTDGLDPRGFLQVQDGGGFADGAERDREVEIGTMLLVLDVGNTNTVLGVFAKAATRWRRRVAAL